MRKTLAAVAAAALVLAAVPLHADGPGAGRLTRTQLRIAPRCRADVTVRWHLRTVLGETRVYGNVKYDNPRGDEEGCAGGPRIRRIWLQGETDALNLRAPLYVPLVPLWPQKPGEWGFSVTASPAWHEVVYGRPWNDEHTYHACGEEVARYFFAYGAVTGFVLQEGWRDSTGISAEAGPC